MKYTLHNRLGSGGFAVQASLAVAGIDFAYEPLASVPNEPLGPTIQALNPWGQVPVLETEDGTKIAELAAILAHLSYAEPSLRQGPKLWIDDHPLFLRWTVFLAVNVYEAILRRIYTDRYYSALSDEPGAVPLSLSNDDKALIEESLRRAAKARIHAAFACIENATAAHRFLLSDRMSPCDIFLAMLYAWYNKKPDLPKCTWITTQIATHKDIRAIWAQNFHDRLDFKWHRL